MLKLLDISEIKGSSHTIYWATKNDELSDFSNLQTGWKKLKSTGKLTLNFAWMTMLKAIKHTTSLSFWACEKKIVEFTDSTHRMYWPAKIA